MDDRIALERENAVLVLAEATRKFEEIFGNVVAGLPQRFSQTGEEYIEVTNDGLAKGGHQVYDFITGKRILGQTIHLNYRDATDQWLQEVRNIALPLTPATKTLYWRVRPEIGRGHVDIHASNGLFRMPTWQIYSRFLISDKPVNHG